ncbi:BMP2 [Branchiostoma lanceolatum]|uniref:BMP2 protein n=1 Tax=Branchiostoma lanceolatum TaxID=7740 RepID=A0A8K0A6H6_BRALA|nr:BMP2 [Branchiostoma lanceolatum]
MSVICAGFLFWSVLSVLCQDVGGVHGNQDSGQPSDRPLPPVRPVVHPDPRTEPETDRRRPRDPLLSPVRHAGRTEPRADPSFMARLFHHLSGDMGARKVGPAPHGATTIRFYRSQEADGPFHLRHESGSLAISFNVSSLQDAAVVTSAQLRVFRRAQTSWTKTTSSSCRLYVFRTYPDDVKVRQPVSRRRFHSNSSGWEVFNITQWFSRLQGQDRTLQLVVKVKCRRGGNGAALVGPRNDTHHPSLVLYIRESKDSNTSEPPASLPVTELPAFPYTKPAELPGPRGFPNIGPAELPGPRGFPNIGPAELPGPRGFPNIGPAATKHGSPAATRDDSPAVDTRQGSPAVETPHGSPGPETPHGSPVPETPHGSPVPETRHDASAVETRHGSLAAMRQGSPVLETPQGSPADRRHVSHAETPHGSPGPETRHDTSAVETRHGSLAAMRHGSPVLETPQGSPADRRHVSHAETPLGSPGIETRHDTAAVETRHGSLAAMRHGSHAQTPHGSPGIETPLGSAAVRQRRRAILGRTGCRPRHSIRPRHADNSYPRRPCKTCKRHGLYVDFEDLGWDWIIAPVGYTAYYCKGQCPAIMGQHLRPTNHAVVQNILGTLDARVPPAKCVPAALRPISVLHYEDNGSIVYKEYPDMVAMSCACR